VSKDDTLQVSASSRWIGRYIAVNGAPFPIIGAEVHNSSSSTLEALRQSFTTVEQLGANTVLAPVAWELLEPAEGTFDYTQIDVMISTARDLGLRLIPLWFGSWKNAASTYAPTWVKTDLERFPRAVLADGRRIEHLTAFSPASRDADARAFAALMRRIHVVDATRTVLAVQVENEVGLLGDTRDRSQLAEAAFAGPVPADVVTAVAGDPSSPLHNEWVSVGSRHAGTWAEVFPPGDRLDEAFMATAFASYVGKVAAAGAAHHDVPLFVNAWLDADSVLDGPIAVAGGKRPGAYPSGGPVIPVAAIWERLAPALDFLAVDLYVDDAEPVLAAYRGRRDRLFVPELRADATGIAQMFSALGRHRALGVSPFGVDSLDPAHPDSAALVDAYSLLSAVAVLIRDNPDAAVNGFTLTEAEPDTQFQIGDVTIRVDTGDEGGMVTPANPGYGITVEDGDGLYIIGRGFSITLAATDGQRASFTSVTQYRLDGGRLKPVRHLNGDETAGGTLVRFPLLGTPLLPGRVIPTRTPDAEATRISVYKD
jgi:hypothetical protein